MAKIISKKKILIFDQIELNRKILTKVLKKLKYYVVEAKSFEESLEILTSTKKTDAFITSLNHDDYNEKIIFKIKNVNPTVPIVILTADCSTRSILKYFSDGFSDYLSKPLKQDDLENTLNEIFYPSQKFLEISKQLNMFNEFSVPIFMMDRNRKVTYYNKSFSSLFKFTRQHINSNPLCCSLLKFDLCKEECVCTRIFQSKKITRIREIVSHASHTPLSLYASFTPLFNDHDEVHSVLISLSDLSSENELHGNYNVLYKQERLKTKELEKSQHEYLKLNHELELKVHSRTQSLSESKAEIKEVLDHIDIAILTFDQSGKLTQGVSEYCKNIFNINDISNMSLYDVLGLDKNPALKNELKNWIKCCYQLFSQMSWADILNLCPLNHWEFNNKFLVTTWNPISVNNQLNNLMMMTRDNTEAVILEKKLSKEKSIQKENAQVINIFLKNNELNTNPILLELEECLTSIKNILERDDILENIDHLFRYSHTIKGGAGFLNADMIVQQAHQLEDVFSEIRSSKKIINKTGILDDFNSMEKIIQKFLDLALKMGFDYHSNESHIKLKRSEINQYINALQDISTSQNKDPKTLLSIADSLKQKSMIKCSDCFEHFITMTDELALRRDKKIKPLHITTGDVLLSAQLSQDLLDILIHLIRNSIDHGIESSEIRLENKKNEFGYLSLTCEKVATSINIVFSDDGQGIDPDKVYQKALRMNLIQKNDLTIQEKQELIFLRGLSTKEEVTDLSGRGVGLDVVMEKVKALNGKIKLKSSQNKGTQWTLSLPH